MSKDGISRRRRRQSGGNVILESVFTLLPTFALIFGLVDFGLMIFPVEHSSECRSRRVPLCDHISGCIH